MDAQQQEDTSKLVWTTML